MSVTLWLDTEKEETIELGGTIPVYEAFAEMNHAVGDAWFTEYPDLSGVLTQCETQEDADPAWLADVRVQAGRFLDQYRERLSNVAVEILEELRDS